MKSSGQIRSMARNVLSGNWGSAVGVTAINYGINYALSTVIFVIAYIFMFIAAIGSAAGVVWTGMFFPDSISRIAAPGTVFALVLFLFVYIGILLVTTLVSSNLLMGQIIYHTNLASGRRANVTDIFLQFKRGFLKAFGLSLFTGLKTCLWVYLFYIPGVIMITVAETLSAVNVMTAALLNILGLCAVVAGIIFGVAASYRYAMSYYVLADNPNVGIREAVKCSKQLMRSSKVRLFVLDLSFIGWAILALFTCGIGNLFLIPYTAAARAVFYCDLIGRPVCDSTVRQCGYNVGEYNQSSNNTGTDSKASEDAMPAPKTPIAAPEVVEEAPEVHTTESRMVDISKIGEGAPSVEDIGKNAWDTDTDDEISK